MTATQFLTEHGTILHRHDDGQWWKTLSPEDADDVAYEADATGHPLDFDGSLLPGRFL